jgi:pyrroline-5-carboxylate reductase
MGLPRDLAYRLAAQTVLGAGSMVLSTGTHPAQLKDDVTSPAGNSTYAMHSCSISWLFSLLEKFSVSMELKGA